MIALGSPSNLLCSPYPPKRSCERFQFSNARCKRHRKIEDMAQSHTVDELLNLVGRGRIDVSCATDVARAVLRDGVEHETINKLASLGAFGNAQSNSERDLHRWMRNLFGLSLQPYTIYLPLKAIFHSCWGLLSNQY